MAILAHEVVLEPRTGATYSKAFKLRFRLPRHAHDGGRTWYLLRLVAVMHLNRGVGHEEIGNLTADMNGRTGLSPLVGGTTVHGRDGFVMHLSDLIADDRPIRTTSTSVRIDAESYGQIGGVHPGGNEFEVTFVNLGAKPTIASVQLLPGTGVYVTSHKSAVVGR